MHYTNYLTQLYENHHQRNHWLYRFRYLWTAIFISCVIFYPLFEIVVHWGADNQVGAPINLLRGIHWVIILASFIPFIWCFNKRKDIKNITEEITHELALKIHDYLNDYAKEKDKIGRLKHLHLLSDNKWQTIYFYLNDLVNSSVELTVEQKLQIEKLYLELIRKAGGDYSLLSVDLYLNNAYSGNTINDRKAVWDDKLLNQIHDLLNNAIKIDVDAIYTIQLINSKYQLIKNNDILQNVDSVSINRFGFYKPKNVSLYDIEEILENINRLAKHYPNYVLPEIKIDYTVYTTVPEIKEQLEAYLLQVVQQILVNSEVKNG